jgi:hypothetical protein
MLNLNGFRGDVIKTEADKMFSLGSDGFNAIDEHGLPEERSRMIRQGHLSSPNPEIKGERLFGQLETIGVDEAFRISAVSAKLKV